ncbi:HAD family hydrolase [Tellurirhabdus bombi]|uniref:HAD family hydrolase n=1 Tax=Tellurirhabdus bombi TaxID=2907205 RepID=UPI001F22CF7F|nr:HAD family phosphatase [Tellurirhabdus bombi]
MYAAIFDMDGVIAHTNPYHHQTWGEYAQRYFNHQLTDAEFIQYVSGRTNADIITYLLAGKTISPEDIARLGDAKEALFREVYAPHATAVPGLVAFLQTLKANNVRTAVATSAPVENLTFIIEALGLADYFDVLLDISKVTKPKPDPEIYLTAMRHLGVQPGQSVVFEDSIPGIQAGVASGARVVGVATTHAADELPNVDDIITDFTEMTFERYKKLVDLSLANQ